MSPPSRIRPALLASALLLATASVTASDPKQPRTIIVMDGSGSMWGQIDGRPKLEIARVQSRRGMRYVSHREPLVVAPVAISQMSAGAPKAPVMMPTGRLTSPSK